MGCIWDDELLDNLAILSFVLGMANYGENLSQSDKDEMMSALDEKTSAILERLELDLEDQNNMLREILKRLDRLEKKDESDIS